MIKVRYSSIDGHGRLAKFKTLNGASRFARKWIGDHPDIGRSYAVSDDGIGKITVSGATLAELFPATVAPVITEQRIAGCATGNWHVTKGVKF
jgi:hypothetical protein